MKKFTNPISSLKSRNFFLYWLGLSISQTGAWMQNIAQPWLALLVTNNPALVGVVGAAQFMPIMLFSLFSGVVVDKFNKKILLFISQLGLCVVSLLFALSVIFDFATFGVILVLSIATGLFNALDAPCRQSIIYELLDDPSEVPNAVALNSMSVSVSRILGPSLAGLVMAKFGIAMCFLVNTISFIAIFISLFYIKTKVKLPKIAKSGVLNSIKEGFCYIKNHEILIEPLVWLLIIGTWIPNYSVTISAFVKFNLGASEKDFGILMSYLGIGAFFGALYIALTSKSIDFKVAKFSAIISTTLLFCIGFAGGFMSTAVLLVGTAFFFMIALSTINSVLQLHSKPEFRGRVMSVYTLFFLGSTPIGAGLTGLIVQKYGADKSFMICAIIIYVTLILWLFLKKFMKFKG